MLLRAWRYRYYIFSLISNEFMGRFERSRSGGLWMEIHSIIQVVIFTFVLSSLVLSSLPGIDNKDAYVLNLRAGTLAWALFSNLLSRSLTVFGDNRNRNLLKNILDTPISVSRA